MARKRHKVVVFCKRLATVRKLRKELHHALNEERVHAGKVWQSALRKLSRLGASPEIKAFTRMGIYTTGRNTCPVSAATRTTLEAATQKPSPIRSADTNS
jgi:hypothetical protein